MRSKLVVSFAGLALVAMPGIGYSQTSPVQGAAVVESQTPMKELAPGLTYSRADRRAIAEGESWWFASLGIARSDEEMKQLSTCREKIKLEGFSGNFTLPGRIESEYTNYIEVGAGRFATRAEAQSFVDGLPRETFCNLEIRHTGMYSFDATAPQLVHVLKIDPTRFDGQLTSARGSKAAIGRTKPSDVMKMFDGALAATNGGYFVMEAKDGLVGESAGISVIGGRLISEPTKGRPWALIRNGQKLEVVIRDREPSEPAALVLADGKMILLDGINRRPGTLRNCGALYDPGFANAVHDQSCNPADEIIAILPDSRIGSEAFDDAEGFEVGRHGHLKPLQQSHRRDMQKLVLFATGTKRQLLRDVALARQQVRLSLGSFVAGDGTYAVNGGPTLIENGKSAESLWQQGWPFEQQDAAQAMNMHRFINMRAPRTALGVTKTGEILLVVVDGWRYRTDNAPPVPMNGGATIGELVQIMTDLGAHDAINLDGGGSSVMISAGALVSHPSDETGERAVGDSLLLLPDRPKQ